MDSVRAAYAGDQFRVNGRLSARAPYLWAVAAGLGLATAYLSSLLSTEVGVPTRSRGANQLGDRPGAPTAIRFRADDSVIVRVGGLSENPELEFRGDGGLLRATWTSRGGIVVIDVDRLWLLDTLGAKRAIVGSRGSGPGQFLNLASICTTTSDTLVVWDAGKRQAMILGPLGDFVRDLRPPTARSVLAHDACMTDGTVLFFSVERGPTRNQSNLVLRRVKLDGSRAGPETTLRVATPLSLVQRRLSVLGENGWIVVGDGASGSFVMRSTEGDTQMTAQTAGTAQPVTPTEFRHLARRSLPERSSKSQVAARMRIIRQNLTEPLRWPAYGRILSGHDGKLWLESRRIDGSFAQAWTAYDLQGQRLGELLLPDSIGGLGRFRVMDFSSNKVVGYSRDADGALWLQVVALRHLKHREASPGFLDGREL